MSAATETPSIQRPRVIAHRGNSSEAPENTIAAFEAALAVGAAAIEVDLQLTADGYVVVFHDDDLDRTSDLTGPVGERDARALASADAGSWFAPEFVGERIPSIDDLVRWAVDHPEIGWLLEFKGPWDARTVAPVLETVRAAGVRERCTVQSFDPSTVRALASAGPDFRVEALIEGLPTVADLVALGFVQSQTNVASAIEPEPSAATSPPLGDPSERARLLVAALRAVRAAGCNPGVDLLIEHPEAVALLRASGFSVTPWTLDDPADWQRAVSTGVDAIITNRPRALAEWLASN